MHRSAVPSIDISSSASGLTIVGRVLALTDGTFDATLTLDKNGASGSMKTRQGGRLDLSAGKDGSVAKIGISYQPGDTVDVKLEVTVDGKPVARAHTALN